MISRYRAAVDLAKLIFRSSSFELHSGKGMVDPVLEWPDHLIVVDPAPIIATAERLERKGGREAMARCPTNEDAELTAVWLVDRLSRLQPNLAVNSRVDKA